MPAIVGNGLCRGGFGRWGGVAWKPAPFLATESEDEGGFPRSAPGPANPPLRLSIVVVWLIPTPVSLQRLRGAQNTPSTPQCRRDAIGSSGVAFVRQPGDASLRLSMT